MDQFEILKTIDANPGIVGHTLTGSAGGKSLRGLFMNGLVRREKHRNGFKYYITEEGRVFMKNGPYIITADMEKG